MVTMNVPVFVMSATLVAVTVTLVCVETVGAVSTPADEIVPVLVDHVTDCDGEFDPATMAEHVDVAPEDIVVGVQVTVTPVTPEPVAATVTFADPDFVVSTVLVAVMVNKPAALAVNTPAGVIDPPVALHVTD
jgi:hypothetical protein